MSKISFLSLFLSKKGGKGKRKSCCTMWFGKHQRNTPVLWIFFTFSYQIIPEYLFHGIVKWDRLYKIFMPHQYPIQIGSETNIRYSVTADFRKWF